MTEVRKRKRIVYEISSDDGSSSEEEVKKKSKSRPKSKKEPSKRQKFDNYLHTKDLEELYSKLWSQQSDSLSKMLIMEGKPNTGALNSDEITQKNGFPMCILADDMTSGKTLCVLALATLYPTVRALRTDVLSEKIQEASSSVYIPLVLSRMIVSYLSEGQSFSRKTECPLMLTEGEERKAAMYAGAAAAGVGFRGNRLSSLPERLRLYNECQDRADLPCQMLPMGNLFVVSHGLVGQWQKEALGHLPAQYTNVRVLRTEADFNCWPTHTNFIDPETSAVHQIPRTKQEIFASMASSHIVICSSTRYNKLAKLCFDNDIVWQRVFWDEAHSISIPAAHPIDAVRYWCITATPTVLAAYTKRTLHFLHLMFSNQTDVDIENISIRHSGLKELDVKTTQDLEPFHKIIVPCIVDPLVLVYAGCWGTRTDLGALIEGATSKILKYHHKTSYPGHKEFSLSGRHMSWFECLCTNRRASPAEVMDALRISGALQICIGCCKMEPNAEKLVLLDCCSATYHNVPACLPQKCPSVACRYKRDNVVTRKYFAPVRMATVEARLSLGKMLLGQTRKNIAELRLKEAEIDKQTTNSEAKLNQLAEKQRRARLELVKFDSVADNYVEKEWKQFEDGETKRLTKIQTLLKLLQQSRKLKTVIFTNELTLAQFKPYLEDAKLSEDFEIVEIKGQGTAIDSRLERFKSGKVQAIWLNVHHNGAGHQLPFADQLIILDSEGSLVEDQVITRAHRYGRPKNSPLRVYCLTFETISERQDSSCKII